MADSPTAVDYALQALATIAPAVASYLVGKRSGRRAGAAESDHPPRCPTPQPGEIDHGLAAVIRHLGTELEKERDAGRDLGRQLRETERRWREEREALEARHAEQLQEYARQLDERDQRIAQLLEQVERLTRGSG